MTFLHRAALLFFMGCFNIATSKLVFNELMINPLGATDSKTTWIELHNTEDSTIALNGLYIDTCNSSIESTVCVIQAIATSVSIGPFGYVTIGNNNNIATNGGIHIDILFPLPKYSFGSGNNNVHKLNLLDAQFATVDSINWKSPLGTRDVSPVFLAFGFTPGASLARINAVGATADVSNWKPSITPIKCNTPSGDKGTPGKNNTFVWPLVCPTKAPTTAPTKNPTKAPTKVPTKAPTRSPTKAPTKVPTKAPTKVPSTSAPTKAPTTAPTKAPTKAPSTNAPTNAPTKAPSTNAPTKAQINLLTKAPTKPPAANAQTKAPTTNAQTKAPTTNAQTKAPSKAPTKAPTKVSTKAPTKAPVKAPIKASIDAPTKDPVIAAPTSEPLTKEKCGLFNLSIICLNGCGLIGTILGWCDN